MQRRSFLQMILASPLVGFLKKPDNPDVQMSCGSKSEDLIFDYGKPAFCIDCHISEPTVTSGGPVAYYDGTWFYVKRMVKVHQNLMDETIIKAMS